MCQEGKGCLSSFVCLFGLLKIALFIWVVPRWKKNATRPFWTVEDRAEGCRGLGESRTAEIKHHLGDETSVSFRLHIEQSFSKGDVFKLIPLTMSCMCMRHLVIFLSYSQWPPSFLSTIPLYFHVFCFDLWPMEQRLFTSVFITAEFDCLPPEVNNVLLRDGWSLISHSPIISWRAKKNFLNSFWLWFLFLR